MFSSTAIAQEAQGVVDEQVRGAVKGLDVDVEFDLAQSSVKTIYVVFSSHWDFFYTDPDDVLRDQLIRHVDDLIETAKANPDFRWSMEAFWHIEGWLRGDPSEERQKELAELIRSGQISVGAMQQMLITLPDEIINRMGYQAADWGDRFRVPPSEIAVEADFTGGSWGLVQALARSGVKYMLNSHHIVFMPHDDIGRKDQPFWWEGPDGSRLLVWRMEYTSAIFPYCIHPSAAKFLIREDIGPRAAELSPLELTSVGLKNELKKLAAEGYDKDALLVVCSHDNVPAHQAIAVMQHMEEWNAKYGTPKLVVAAPEDFFRHMEEKYGPSLPVKRGDYRPWFWGADYDSVPGRQAAADFLDSEKYWGLLAMQGNGGYPEWRLDSALADFMETSSHGGGAYQASVLRRKYTEFRTERLHDDLIHTTDYMRRTGFALIGDRVHSKEPSIAVVNSLSWPRTGIVEALVTDDQFPAGAGLVDPSTGKPIAVESEPVTPAWSGRPPQGAHFYTLLSNGDLATKRLRFMAKDVPGLGFKTLTIIRDTESGAAAQPEESSLALPGTVENAYWRISLDKNGGIVQARDLAAGRDLVPADAEARFGELVVFEQLGSGGFLDVKQHSLGRSPATATIRRGSVTIQVSITRPEDIQNRTEIVLTEGAPELRLRLHIDPERFKEMRLSHWIRPRVDFPLSYALDRYQTLLQGPDFVRGAETNNYDHPRPDEKGYGAIWFGSYVTDSTHGLSVSSRECYELIQMLGLDEGKPVTASFLVGPNGRGPYDEEIPIEIVLTPDAGEGFRDHALVYRRAWGGAMPLRAKPCRSGELTFWDDASQFFEDDDGTRDGARSILNVESPNVVVTALKQARGGQPNEFALRLLEIGGQDSTRTRVVLPASIRKAWRADQLEHKGQEIPIRDHAIEVDLSQNRLLTLKLER